LGYNIQGRRYDPSGTPLGSEFQINTYYTGLQVGPAVAADAGGSFVVAWNSFSYVPGYGESNRMIRTRRYDASGAAWGNDVQVSSYTSEVNLGAEVAAAPDGDFVITWTGGTGNGNDTSVTGIHARRYRADGTPLGDQFQVNAYTTNRQQHSAVATDSGGNFVVAWTSYGSSGTDHSGFSVQAQRFDSLFRDGFEPGDTSRWSLTFP